jgi:hypothetical protein
MPKPRRRTGRKRQAAITLPAVVTVIEIDNPLYNRAHDGDRTNPKRITAAYNPRESYVGFLHAKSIIDDAEFQAGVIIRAAYEDMGGVGARAIDYTREHVDGGGIAQTISDRHLKASRTLQEARKVLGEDGYNITIKLAAQGLWPKDLRPNDVKAREVLGTRLRECLDILAVLWGKKKRRDRSLLETC